jgi:transcriptional regulator with XRE-family HTH domain
MKPNEVIRNRRIALGLKESDIAAQTEIGRSWYCDVENTDNDVYTHTPLRDLRIICTTLKLDLLSLFNIKQLESSSTSTKPRNKLIESGRQALGITQEQLSDRIGFDTIAVEDMEKTPDYLEGWPIELIQKLANELRIPIQELLKQ